tara:strand:+ start:1893 stop:2522 length:630 start_codon:yes stop_codon:yes gene_type:complete
MHIQQVFKSVIWTDLKLDFLKSLDKASNKYIREAKKTKEAKQYIKKFGDFGRSFHSGTLLNDTDFWDLKRYINQKALEYLNHQGYDMSFYDLFFSELWVQEFAKKGGGHHSAHIHWNQHVSGFYFLKCSEKTSHPIFHDPRTGARATKLRMRDDAKGLWPGTETVNFHPKPGTLLLFPGYMEHEFSVDPGFEPFRFIHFNIQAIPKVIK